MAILQDVRFMSDLEVRAEIERLESLAELWEAAAGDARERVEKLRSLANLAERSKLRVVA
jgi:hypothetical protein